jgi:hypothetical protein
MSVCLSEANMLDIHVEELIEGRLLAVPQNCGDAVRQSQLRHSRI